MARYRESGCKLCRIAGASLCGKPKCAFVKRPYAPGQHGQVRKKLSEYAIQLREKQKVKWYYGMLEKQFYNTYVSATRKKGVTGTIFLQLLECRLDNILYRSGLVGTRQQARQLINHNHVLVNGRKMNIPSARIKPGSLITVKDKSKPVFKAIQESRPQQAIVPDWLETDFDALAVKFVAVPEREQIDQTFNENLIIEYYSR